MNKRIRVLTVWLYTIVAVITLVGCASVKMGPLEVEITENDTPFTVISVVVVFLLAYLGVRLINRYIK